MVIVIHFLSPPDTKIFCELPDAGASSSSASAWLERVRQVEDVLLGGNVSIQLGVTPWTLTAVSHLEISG